MELKFRPKGPANIKIFFADVSTYILYYASPVSRLQG